MRRPTPLQSAGLALAVLAAIIVLAWRTPPRPMDSHAHIIIDKSRNCLYLFSSGKLLKAYPVATGREIGLTPEGGFHIASKMVDPEGGIAAGSLYGSRWMGLATPIDPTGTKHGIHGTNEPASIGIHASAGCVRMGNVDVEDLYSRVEIGTPVYIVRGIPLFWYLHRRYDL